jgi:hypothetical protein
MMAPRFSLLLALLGAAPLAQTAPPAAAQHQPGAQTPAKLKLFHLPSFQTTVQPPMQAPRAEKFAAQRAALRMRMDSQMASVCSIPLLHAQPKDPHDAMAVSPSPSLGSSKPVKVPAPPCDDKK